MPFFPGDRKVPGSQRSGPVPATRVKKYSDTSKDKTGAAKWTNLQSSSEPYLDDRFSETNTAYSPPPTERPPKFVVNEYSEPKMPSSQGGRRSENGRTPAPPGPRRGRPDDLPERMQGLDVSSVHAVPIYEHCLLLRKHRISVKLGRGAATTMAQQLRTNRPHITAGDNFGRDVYNPTAQDIRLVNQAIAFVLANGGEVEMGGLNAPDYKCPACREQFQTEMGLDDHCNQQHTSCRACPETFSCRTLFDDHLQEVHNGQYGPYHEGRGTRDDRIGRDDRAGRDDQSTATYGHNY